MQKNLTQLRQLSGRTVIREYQRLGELNRGNIFYFITVFETQL